MDTLSITAVPLIPHVGGARSHPGLPVFGVIALLWGVTPCRSN